MKVQIFTESQFLGQDSIKSNQGQFLTFKGYIQG